MRFLLFFLFSLALLTFTTSRKTTYKVRIHRRPTHQEESFEEYEPETESWNDGVTTNENDIHEYDETNDFLIDGHATIHTEIDVSDDLHSHNQDIKNPVAVPRYDRVFGDYSRQYHGSPQAGLFLRTGSELGIGALVTVVLVLYLL